MRHLLTPKEVSDLLRVHTSRLRRWRRQRRGPPYLRLGPHPRYPLDALVAWINAALEVRDVMEIEVSPFDPSVPAHTDADAPQDLDSAANAPAGAPTAKLGGSAGEDA